MADYIITPEYLLWGIVNLREMTADVMIMVYPTLCKMFDQIKQWEKKLQVILQTVATLTTVTTVTTMEVFRFNY
jgi:hypothetical protein